MFVLEEPKDMMCFLQNFWQSDVSAFSGKGHLCPGHLSTALTCRWYQLCSVLAKAEADFEEHFAIFWNTWLLANQQVHPWTCRYSTWWAWLGRIQTKDDTVSLGDLLEIRQGRVCFGPAAEGANISTDQQACERSSEPFGNYESLSPQPGQREFITHPLFARQFGRGGSLLMNLSMQTFYFANLYSTRNT